MPAFSNARSTTINADPAVVHGLIDDFREWRKWSPWEDVDPNLQRTYSGAERGVGSRYEWSGNNKAGTGSMEIVESDPSHTVIDLQFMKPFKARNVTRFDLRPTGSAESGRSTEVTWTMSGERNALMAIAGKVFFDKAIGKDFEKGLARLKAAAESRA